MTAARLWVYSNPVNLKGLPVRPPNRVSAVPLGKGAMETPIHAAKEVDKDETVPRVVAAIAGVVILAVVGIAIVYSDFWSPAAPATVAQPH